MALNKDKETIEKTEFVDVFDNPEPWSKVETRLIIWSFGLAAGMLLLLGFVVNKYILHAF